MTSGSKLGKNIVCKEKIFLFNFTKKNWGYQIDKLNLSKATDQIVYFN